MTPATAPITQRWRGGVELAAAAVYCLAAVLFSFVKGQRESFLISVARISELGHPSAADTAKSLNSLAQCSCWAVLCCVLPKYAICAWKWRASAPVRSIFTTIIAIIIIIVPIYFSFVLYSWDMLSCSWWGCYIGRQCNVGICGDGKQRSIGDNERTNDSVYYPIRRQRKSPTDSSILIIDLCIRTLHLSILWSTAAWFCCSGYSAEEHTQLIMARDECTSLAGLLIHTCPCLPSGPFHSIAPSLAGWRRRTKERTWGMGIQISTCLKNTGFNFFHLTFIAWDWTWAGELLHNHHHHRHCHRDCCVYGWWCGQNNM